MAVFISGSDESAGKNQRSLFVHAGFVAPEDDWSRYFGPAWQQRVLDGPPAIPYLHMTDIRSPQWRSQYGLTRLEADDRVDEAFAVIDSMGALYPIGVRMDAGDFRDKFATAKLLLPSGVAKTFEPDYLCFVAYAFRVFYYVGHAHPETEKVDLIIERNGPITKHIGAFHSHMASTFDALGEPSLSRLVGELIPGGKDRIPLQAADVLCWHEARRRAGTLDAADGRRYSKIAHRKGSNLPLTRRQISKLKAALGV